MNVLEFVPDPAGRRFAGHCERGIPDSDRGLARDPERCSTTSASTECCGDHSLQLDPSAVASLQQQYPEPGFSVSLLGAPCVNIPNNLPIAAGTNFRPHTSAGVEFDIQIPIIQAPFRIYYAYNYLRLDQTLTPPLGAFYVPPAERDSLKQLGVYDTQIVPSLQSFLEQLRSSQTIPPGLFEPKTTLRFAVSRTF